MKPYSHTKRQEERKVIPIEKVAIPLICLVTLLGLTVLGLLGPVWESVDEWLTGNLENQIKFTFILMFVGLCGFGLWAYVRYKNQ